ncbi:MAG: AcvB/VirJ family lysyl-phosphatidylglycerol hydrolase [Hyphomonadaceae bacterium]
MHKAFLTALMLLATTGTAAPAMADTGAAHAIPIAATYGASHPRVALFLSGDGGWNQGVVSMAQTAAGKGYLVAGIDFPKYLHERQSTAGACIPLGADLLATAAAIEKQHGLSTSQPPLLIGYSSGATGVYATLLDAAPGTFQGGLSLGFAPDLDTTHPICTAANLPPRPDAKLGFVYPSAARLVSPWVALQGEIDLDVSPPATRAFVERVGNATIVMLPKVGHGFSVERNWMPQFKSALDTLGKLAIR